MRVSVETSPRRGLLRTRTTKTGANRDPITQALNMSKLPPSGPIANAAEIAAAWRAFERSTRSSVGHDAVSAASRVVPALLTLTVDSLPGGQCGGARYPSRKARFALSPEKRERGSSTVFDPRATASIQGFAPGRPRLSTPERLTATRKAGKKSARLELDARPGFGTCKMESGPTDENSQLRSAVTPARGPISFFPGLF